MSNNSKKNRDGSQIILVIMFAIIGMWLTWKITKRAIYGRAFDWNNVLATEKIIGKTASTTKVPRFTLTNINGKQVSLSDLEGKVWIVNFIDSANDASQRMIYKMRLIQRSLNQYPNIAFVSITLNPEKDTSKALSQYVRQFNISTHKWYFLTGDKKMIYDLATNGFKLSIGLIDKTKINPRFVLIDKKGYIQNYYISTDNKSMKTILGEAIHLSQEEK